MRQLSSSSSALTILFSYSAYLMARLRSNPLLADVSTFAQEAHAALYSAAQAFWAARTETMAAASIRDTKRGQVDTAFRFLRVAVLAEVKNDRSSRLCSSLFPAGFFTLLIGKPEEVLARARKILQKLGELNDPLLAQAMAGLQSAADELDAELQAFKTAADAERTAAISLESAKEIYCTKYGQIYGRLLDLTGSRGIAETYFRSAVPRPTTSPTPTPTPTPTPSPAPTPSPTPTPTPTSQSQPGPTSTPAVLAAAPIVAHSASPASPVQAEHVVPAVAEEHDGKAAA